MKNKLNINLTKCLDIYTDGAVSGTPGPAGSGVIFIQDSKIIKTLVIPLGTQTNNFAELSAILYALKEIEDINGIKKHRIRIYTDSKYCIGSIKLGWNAKKNKELIRKIKKLVNTFTQLTFHHVKGHSGVWGNEMADQAALKAKKLNSMEK